MAVFFTCTGCGICQRIVVEQVTDKLKLGAVSGYRRILVVKFPLFICQPQECRRDRLLVRRLKGGDPPATVKSGDIGKPAGDDRARLVHQLDVCIPALAPKAEASRRVLPLEDLGPEDRPRIPERQPAQLGEPPDDVDRR
jgi:hypothetical protein